MAYNRNVPLIHGVQPKCFTDLWRTTETLDKNVEHFQMPGPSQPAQKKVNDSRIAQAEIPLQTYGVQVAGELKCFMIRQMFPNP